MSDVERLLTDKKVEYRKQGADLLVHCFNPEHDDSSPSMRINGLEGHFHCFGCGYKGNIFTFFNRHRNVFNAKISKIRERIINIRKASWSGFDIPQDAFFVSGDFAGIPGRIIQEFEAFKTSDMGMENRIVFPIRDATNRVVAFQGRYTHTSAPPKYLVYPAKTSLPWFPNQYKINPDDGTIILVEGLKDALYLRGVGLENVVCIFGTKSVNYDNIVEHITPYILKGVYRVVLLMDGDDAGRRAADHIEKCISRKTDLETIIYSLEDGLDPASMTLKQIQTLTKVYKRE